jgi:hypothetical protein
LAYLLYLDHTIASLPVYDDPSGKWKFTVSIFWKQGGRPTRQMHIIRNGPELFSRFEDAENAGVEAAKSWVDTHLTAHQLTTLK